MTRRLVVYFSWTGTTAKVARALAERLGADLEEIRETRPRSPGFGRFRAAMEAMLRLPAPIAPPERDLSAYGLILLGGPVWAQSMASPIRSFIRRRLPKTARIALFCTEGGEGGERVLAEMGLLAARPPLAELVLDAEAMHSGGWRASMETFVQAVESATPASAARPG